MRNRLVKGLGLALMAACFPLVLSLQVAACSQPAVIETLSPTPQFATTPTSTVALATEASPTATLSGGGAGCVTNAAGITACGRMMIAFMRLAPDRIFLVNPDGSGLVQLTSEADAREWDPQLSPDGRQVAFVRSTSAAGAFGDIYVVNVDGTGRANLTRSLTNNMPAWSPDGRQIAFMSTRDGDSEIYVFNADGSGLRRLTDNFASDVLPVWAPDGRALAFLSDRDGKLKWWLMNTDGSNQHLLADIEAADPSLRGVPVYLFRGTWTPWRGLFAIPLWLQDRGGVITVDPATGQQADITFHDSLHLVFCPDGSATMAVFRGAEKGLDVIHWLSEFGNRPVTDTADADIPTSCGVVASDMAVARPPTPTATSPTPTPTRTPPTPTPTALPPTPTPTAMPPASALSPNLAPNPSFELGVAEPIGWRQASFPFRRLVWENAVAHSGRRSLSVSAPTCTADGNVIYVHWLTSSPVDVDPGQRYLLSAWVRADDPFVLAKGSLILRVAGRTWFVTPPADAPLGPEWRQVQTTVQVPAATSQTEIDLGYQTRQGQCDDANKVYFDDVELRLVP